MPDAPTGVWAIAHIRGVHGFWLERGEGKRRSRSALRRASSALAVVVYGCVDHTPDRLRERGRLEAQFPGISQVVSEAPGIGLASVMTRRACRWRLGDSLLPTVTSCPSIATRPASDRAAAGVAVAAAVARALRDDGGPDALHAGALLDLADTRANRASVQRAVAALQQLVELRPDAADGHNDLAYAHLRLAARTRRGLDALAALDAASRAVGQDSTEERAIENLQVAARLIGIAYGAAAPAREQLVDDNRSSREQFWESVLPRWGAAVLSGDSSAEGHVMDGAHEMARALASRSDDDTPVRAIRRLTRVSEGVARRRVASAHRAYATARALSQRQQFDSARSAYDTAFALAGGLDELREWVMIERAALMPYVGDATGGRRALQSLLAQLPTGVSARRARVEWLLAASLGRTDRREDGVALAASAGRAFQLLGESRNRAATRWLEGELRLISGDHGGVTTLVMSLHDAPGDFASPWRRNALASLAQVARARGMYHAAVLIADDGVQGASLAKVPSVLMDALIVRARARNDAHDLTGAEADVARARAALRATGLSGVAASSGAARIDEIDALLALSRSRHGASAGLDEAWRRITAAASLHEGQGNLPRAAAAKGVQLQIAVARGDFATAVNVLAQRGDLLDARGTDGLSGASLLTEREEAQLVDAVTRHELLQGRARQALVVRLGATVVDQLSASHRGVHLALVGDSLVWWQVDRGDVAVTVVPVGRTSLLRQLRKAQTLLRHGTSGPALRAELGALDRLFGAAIRAAAGGDSVLVMSVESPLDDVPFAALWNRSTGRYLVEEVALRYLWPTMTSRRVDGRASGALVVSMPSLTEPEFDGLPALPGGDLEARSVSDAWGGSQWMRADRATAGAVRSALGGASVFHFAGHAIEDMTEPDESFLALSSAAGDGSQGRLTAAVLSRLDLSGLRMAVLAACDTRAGERMRGARRRGLAGAFLRAGAQAVVSTDWPVEDDAMHSLIGALHRRVARGEAAWAALRGAQLEQLRRAKGGDGGAMTWAALRLDEQATSPRTP
jgi:CHAT domain-containing protein/tetratricopeptide (TPR) repeat protein